MNNREVAHLWAAQSRPHAKGSNLSFDGATLYSYSTAIGRIYPYNKKKDCGPLATFCERRNLIEIPCARNAWRLHCAEWQSGAYGQLHTNPVMLRVDGEEIQTSQGARIPLAAAPMVWAKVERARKSGRCYEPSGLADVTIGDYALTRIEADGTLVVGCHTIPYSELALMARTLGLQS